MKKEITFTAKQVGERVKERRTELNLTMPELGRRIGVNKSTIQRYEADGVDPKRTMIIGGLANALLTTPEWLTGLSEDKEYDSRTSVSYTHLDVYKRQAYGSAPDGLPEKFGLTDTIGRKPFCEVGVFFIGQPGFHNMAAVGDVYKRQM